MRWMALLLAVPALSSPGFALGPLLPDFLPADTKIVLGFQVRHILDSPLGKEIAAHVTNLPQAKMIPTQFGGIDFTKDVDEVLIATNGGQNAVGLLVLKGRFSGPPITEDPEHGHSLLAILDASTAIAGDEGVVRAALALHGKGTPPPGALESKVEPLAARYDIWGVGEAVDPVDGFSFGAALNKGLDLVAEMQLHSAADVAQFNQYAKVFEGMVHSQASSTKFNLQVQGRTIRLTLNVPEEELKKAMEKQTQAMTSAILQQIQPQPPKPKQQLKILQDTEGNTVNVRLQGGGH